MKVVVYHRSYGCDTGCCGHAVEVDGKEVEFDFSHPYGEVPEHRREWIESLVKTVGCDPADIDWENCVVSDD